MKTLNQLLALPIFFISTSTFAQNNSDALLTTSLYGTWEHVSSTYPTGDIVTYHREINFQADGIGFCTKYENADTLNVSFQWEVKDSVIYLFVTNKRGVRMDGDAQQITMLDLSKMYLADAFGEDQVGRVLCYQRNQEATQVKF